eukprot:3934163-Rhodomonas_salina.8
MHAKLFQNLRVPRLFVLYLEQVGEERQESVGFKAVLSFAVLLHKPLQLCAHSPSASSPNPRNRAREVR